MKRSLSFPFPNAPEFGSTVEVAPGILCARLPLPFSLDHVNVYLIDDGDGWAVLDTGLANDQTRALWDVLLAGPLAGRRLTRLIVTHFHPDHIGLAGWLTRRHRIPLLTGQTSYLRSLNTFLNPDALDAEPYKLFYRQHGLDEKTIGHIGARGRDHVKQVSPLPPTFARVLAGDTLDIGGREFSVMAGEGHAPEQLMLYCAAENFLIAADQVLTKITPSIGVWAVDPDGDPLGLYMRSLDAMTSAMPDNVLVLSGHQLPFVGLHTRVAELVKHHELRCAAIAEACATPMSVSDLVPVVFRTGLDSFQKSFAFSEVLAHVNYMLARHELAPAPAQGEVRRIVGQI